MRALAAAATLALVLATPPRPEGRILVFGAASLTETLQELGTAFADRTGTEVVFSFGASSDLARQIQAGAPADVFFSADTARMDLLEEAGRVRRADRREFLSNALVVVVPRNAREAPSSPEGLATLPRVALADPEIVPAGIYAKAWLTGLGLWPRLAPKVVPTLDVRAALAAVENGAVPAAVVYRTDAAMTKRARVAFVVRDGPEILYSVAPVTPSRNRAPAGAFVAFLEGDTARQAFRRHGFAVIRRDAPP